MIDVGSTVRLGPEVRGSYLSGMVGMVVRLRHFEAQVSAKAAQAAARKDLWSTAVPDIPAEDWADVELPPFEWNGRSFPKTTIFLPIGELRTVPVAVAAEGGGS